MGLYKYVFALIAPDTAACAEYVASLSSETPASRNVRFQTLFNSGNESWYGDAKDFEKRLDYQWEAISMEARRDDKLVVPLRIDISSEEGAAGRGSAGRISLKVRSGISCTRSYRNSWSNS